MSVTVAPTVHGIETTELNSKYGNGLTSCNSTYRLRYASKLASYLTLKPHNLKELYFCAYHKDTVLFLIPSFSD